MVSYEQLKKNKFKTHKANNTQRSWRALPSNALTQTCSNILKNYIRKTLYQLNFHVSNQLEILLEYVTV